MRIIGGSLRGKKLHSISGRQIRPTADRLRESIFNILSPRVHEAVVLDLFAGTGALGIEALSRGARTAVFIDKSQVAMTLVSRNIAACGLESRATLIRWDAGRNLNCIQSFRPTFDLVFMDPPYDRGCLKSTLNYLLESRSLASDACIVAEHSLSEPIPDMGREMRLTDQRKYGKTLVSFLGGML